MANSRDRLKSRMIKRAKIKEGKRGLVLRKPASLQLFYQRLLLSHIRPMINEVNNAVKELLKTKIAKQHFAQDAGIEASVNNVSDLEVKFQKIFNDKSEEIAQQMVKKSNKASDFAMGASLKEISETLTLDLPEEGSALDVAMEKIVAENVDLIKSIPEEYFDKLKEVFSDSFLSASDIKDALQEVVDAGEITARRAELIAEDQTNKAFNKLNTARMQAIGMNKAIWIHSGGDVHPRETHLEMDGEEFDINEGIYDEDEEVMANVMPGELIFCTCSMQPIASFDEENDLNLEPEE